jgi:agmatine deiminase
MSTTPKADGFHAPAEWEPHSATLIGWPWRGNVWPEHGKRAWRPFLEVIRAVSTSEKVIVIPKPGTFTEEHRMELVSEITDKQVEIRPLPCDNVWMRDTAPIFVVDQGRKEVRGVDWTFNGWGFRLLLEHENDAKVAGAVCEMLGCKKYSSDLVCEGGALAYDGEGTVITTESVLLGKNRNGGKKTKDEIQQILLSNLGAEKVIWLPRGLYGDDEKNTNGHIDNLVAFVAPAVVVLAWTDDETDPQFQRSKMAEDVLKSSTDAKGRKFTIHRYDMYCNLGN